MGIFIFLLVSNIAIMVSSESVEEATIMAYTHTHTHIYIYIYIEIVMKTIVRNSKEFSTL